MGHRVTKANHSIRSTRIRQNLIFSNMNVIKNFPVALLLLSLSSSLAALSPNQAAANVLAQAHDVIAAMVRSNSRLTPEFLRLGFHDCVGGCDGELIYQLQCVDIVFELTVPSLYKVALIWPTPATTVSHTPLPCLSQ
jgi:hypothetical protein